MHLTIGNKLYSSWSLRPWLVLRAFDLPFTETVVPLDTPAFETYRAAAIAKGASGTVPLLEHNGHVVWETMAIIETIADHAPDAHIWPSDPDARAHARAISNEMHAGFTHLRSACPMNLGKRFARRDLGAAVDADVARITAIWRDARSRFGASGGGPFLYGAFSAADAMFAPVVTRLETYSFDVADDTAAYMSAVTNQPAFREWRMAALEEPWVVDADEIDAPCLENYRA